VVLYYYVDGERVSQTKATGIAIKDHKKKEAERIKQQMIVDKQNLLIEQEMIRNRKVHIFSECFKRWVDYKVERIEGTTGRSYRDKSKGIIAYFGQKGTKIEELAARDLLEYYEWALKYGRRNVYKEGGSTALSRRYVRDQATLIKSFLNDAVVQGIIENNPALCVSVPRVKETKVREIGFMDLEQAKRFLEFVKTNPLFRIIYYISKFGLYYGLRRSEILGLRWSAFDFEKNEIEIRHTVVRGESNKVEHRDTVKSESSHRFLPLLDDIKDDLIEIMKSQKESGIFSEDGYVFLWEDGREYDPDYISKLFKKAITACPNVPKNMTLHGLRHSCCAILFQKGWELGEVQNWLGHSDISVTANIYNHVSAKWRNEHGREIDGFFKES
jgi:integrase